MTITSADVAELVKAVAAHDRDAFQQLYTATSAKLFGVGLRILGRREDAEEALQDVFIKIWRGAAGYEQTNYSVMSWLIAIARNNAVDRLRQQRPGGTVDIDTLIDAAPDPEQQAITLDARRVVDIRLRQLSAEKAAMVRAVYLDGASYQALADDLGLPLNTVKTRLRRALLDMRSQPDPVMGRAAAV